MNNKRIVSLGDLQAKVAALREENFAYEELYKLAKDIALHPKPVPISGEYAVRTDWFKELQKIIRSIRVMKGEIEE